MRVLGTQRSGGRFQARLERFQRVAAPFPGARGRRGAAGPGRWPCRSAVADLRDAHNSNRRGTPSPACWGRGREAPDGVWPAASRPAGLRDHKSELSTTHSCFPHPIRRASPDTFPTSWRRGAQPPDIRAKTTSLPPRPRGYADVCMLSNARHPSLSARRRQGESRRRAQESRCVTNRHGGIVAEVLIFSKNLFSAYLLTEMPW